MEKLFIFFLILFGCTYGEDVTGIKDQGQLSINIEFNAPENEIREDRPELRVMLYHNSDVLVKKWMYSSEGVNTMSLESGKYYLEIESVAPESVEPNQLSHYAKTDIFSIEKGKLEHIDLEFSLMPSASFGAFAWD